MRIAIVFGNHGSDPRVIRTCRSLIKMGHEVHFIGWDRQPTPAQPVDLGSTVSHVLRCGTRYGNSAMLAQIQFSWYVFRQLSQIRPDVVCAINEENALRVLPFKGNLYRRLVCDVLDSHRDVGSARRLPIRLLLSLIAELARIGSNTLIATDADRHKLFGRHQPKTKIIGNYPEDPGEHLWKRFPVGPIKIYVAGTLTESRGLRHILAATDQLDVVTICAAGWANDAYAHDIFLKHPRVTNHGFVTLQRSLELAAECDAMFAYYAPTCRNNILASPNKLYEAMSVGRPVIINSEARVSQWVVDNSFGFASPYGDVNQLRDTIKHLNDLRVRLPEFAKHSYHSFQQAYSWDKMETVLAEIYGCENETGQKGARRAAA